MEIELLEKCIQLSQNSQLLCDDCLLLLLEINRALQVPNATWKEEEGFGNERQIRPSNKYWFLHINKYAYNWLEQERGWITVGKCKAKC